MKNEKPEKKVDLEDMTEEEKIAECIELIKTLTPEQLLRVRAILKKDTEIIRIQTGPVRSKDRRRKTLNHGGRNVT